MTPPRFQFTIRGLLWATFWLAASCAAIWYPKCFSDWAIILYWGHYEPHAFHTSMAAAILCIFCWCAAIGALCGRHRQGILVGLIMVAGTVLFLALTIWIIEIHIERRPSGIIYLFGRENPFHAASAGGPSDAHLT